MSGQTSFTVKCAAIILGALAQGAHAISDEFIDPEDGMLDASQYLSQRMLGFLPVPVVITEPAVGNGIGLMGIFFHESEAQKKNKNRAGIIPENITIAGGFATENGSKFGGLGHIGFWRGDTVRYKGGIGYPDMNLDFYSIANQSLSSPIELNIKGPAILQSLMFRLGKSHWLVGAYQTYQHMEMSLANELDIDRLPNEELNDRLENFLESRLDVSQNTSGLGLVVEYDSRDNPMNPEAGFNYKVRAVDFNDAIGSDLEYTQYQLSGLNYWKLSDSFNFGWRLSYEGVEPKGNSPLPPYVLPGINLRGIAKARYQDEQVVTTEIEATYKITPRWHLKGFTGVGYTAATVSELTSDADDASSIGAGFRYLMAKRYGFTMGLDIARGPEETAFYIQAGSSW
ncbi:BamA/TamA family outer membrane protein [Gilvimarinus sp. SDUM040013]|uniref:BamA/TamA family outer membrane protein n=1 Tax=Gilvimarinus gilvus TaxID=3058038 RepID=A0ABU4S1W8_9GAMM|nr:BamA/TamA family outer membrane protein [Gilvimarinus sp. SDUM040013]MDO3385349.1 BamA/TamA family outer membrane protein [Gilvimarinus sp. SDUM040013]MDX6850924.1 BamA/TamA family outer membrane protein [Gilvimarinus sp. SDUM040013]